MNYLERVTINGDLLTILKNVASHYSLGEYTSHKIIELGYEDLNIVLETITGKYFIKAFANFRSSEDIERYIEIMNKVIEAGVAHPKLLHIDGEYLYKTGDISLVVMEYIDAKDLYQSELALTTEEKKFIVKQAALINQLNITPPSVYDSWAIVNFVKEFEASKEFLNDEELVLVSPVVEEFKKKVDLERLPKVFCHGDIIKTNVIKSNGKICILDFSVSNMYPRVQEIAVILCNILFNPDSKQETIANYHLAINEYQEETKLTAYELEVLPVYLKAAHAMHIIGPVKARKVGNDTKENQYWLTQGTTGLKTFPSFN